MSRQLQRVNNLAAYTIYGPQMECWRGMGGDSEVFRGMSMGE
jgi:hypothetical protein